MFFDYIEETQKGLYMHGGLLWLPVVFWLASGPTLTLCVLSLMFYSNECILAYIGLMIFMK